MARTKSQAVFKGRTPSPSPSDTDRPAGPLSIVVSPEDRDVVKVNNASLTELKNACDDAVKRYLSRPDLFKQIYLHTDVRLGLGWLSVFTAGGTALYGYKVDFEKSKPVVWAGLALYIFLTLVQTLYAYFIEGETVFVGKRKTFSKRIITERITLSSRTLPIKSTSPLLATLSSPLSVLSPSNSSTSASQSTSSVSTSSLSPSLTTPAYSLSLSYVRSTNGGKSLLAKGKTRSAQPYTAFFDEQGTMDQERFERWVGELVEQGMDGKTA
ncbi:microsomal signal peptidase 25 kDa subunit-domain-containing protein [Crucibulum laeve]|uniref:Signal peptidase complex subunit 2 n=1 Tax=Crucibulum laeve TaxID=68775 RepID=A0A5C3LK96_9AGAR|nr:microsomal signal peptidase 25 kDa subunit-domain-containing protein [Crucibulum laeve]